MSVTLSGRLPPLTSKSRGVPFHRPTPCSARTMLDSLRVRPAFSPRPMCEVTAHIGRGENAGRTLKESNIVLALHGVGRWNGTPRDFEVSGGSLPESVTDIAVLVQSS